MKTKYMFGIILSVLVMALAISACGGATPAPTAMPTNAPAMGLTITDAWARASGMASAGMEMPTPSGGMGGMEMGGATSAIYMKINSGGMADKLVKAETTVANATELHTVEMKDGMMQMHPVEGGIDVPATGTLELKPGGYHVMLIGLKQDLKAGDKVQVKLTFEKAGVKDVTAEVKPLVQ